MLVSITYLLVSINVLVSITYMLVIMACVCEYNICCVGEHSIRVCEYNMCW
jgi:hypothetical protein